MNTHAINRQFEPWLKDNRKHRSYRLNAGSGLHVVLLILAAILPLAAAMVVTIWAISLGAEAYMAAVFWTSGLVFLALMVDNDEGHQAVLGATGLGLMLLAWMSSRFTPEFGVIAGFIIAAWLAAPIVRCLVLKPKKFRVAG